MRRILFVVGWAVVGAAVWAIILGFVFFQESVTGSTLAGAALIILGCLIASRAKPKLAEPTEVAAV